MTAHSTKSGPNLRAARLIGAVAVAILGQFTINMPEGFFGAADVITPFGAYYVSALLLTTLFCVIGILRHQAWATWAGLLVISGNIAVFLMAMTSDPLVAATVIAWQVVILASQLLHFAPPELLDPRLFRRDREDPLFPWLMRWRAAVQHLAIISLLATIAVVGYELSHHLIAVAICILLNVLTAAASWRLLFHLFRAERRLFALLAVPLAAAGLLIAEPEFMLMALSAFQIMLLVILLGRNPVITETLGMFAASPGIFVIGSFLALIIVGTLLLGFPAAAANGMRVDPIDALFTAVSAVCVTGLTVLDTPVTFSLFGQAVILALIQLGGLGIIVLSTFAVLLLGGGIGLRGEKALGEMFDVPGLRSARRLVLSIVVITLAIEGVGATFLTYGFWRSGLSFGEALWKGVFHAVSAFCNAGFALQSDSMISFQRDPFMLSVIALLVTLGGIGFVVMVPLWLKLSRPNPRPLPVHVKVVMVMWVVLFLSSWTGYLAIEWNHSLRDLAFGDKLMNALFQSISFRTAGFNSVPVEGHNPAGDLFMMSYMFIGGAPGSTAGGIKVTTAAILFACIPALARGESSVRFFGRTIARGVVLRSAAITTMAILTGYGIFLTLLLTQNLRYDLLLFEAVSALGTVGLSLGATPLLDTFGKFMIIVGMFIGRVGPLTIALALGRRSAPRVTLPEESMMVG